jgi:hypothetical protein
MLGMFQLAFIDGTAAANSSPSRTIHLMLVSITTYLANIASLLKMRCERSGRRQIAKLSCHRGSTWCLTAQEQQRRAEPLFFGVATSADLLAACISTQATAIALLLQR